MIFVSRRRDRVGFRRDFTSENHLLAPLWFALKSRLLRQFSRIKNLGFLGACYQYPDTLAATTDHATQTGRHSVPGSPLSKANSPTSPSISMIALVR
jgi:hypothetical protein